MKAHHTDKQTKQAPAASATTQKLDKYSLIFGTGKDTSATTANSHLLLMEQPTQITSSDNTQVFGDISQVDHSSSVEQQSAERNSFVEETSEHLET